MWDSDKYDYSLLVPVCFIIVTPNNCISYQHWLLNKLQVMALQLKG